ncbi:AAEL008997-PA [Aedes aegypti]|uniref:AAEL008997-PA n=2 Tax=Aedes aegypti TaxID=7159 RepID=A0A1S4G375_AEDAE|nr:cuticle protein 19 [Aedes aegypti]EAT39179.1 AAEL008997-PA [Aedes aegypti]
MFKIIVLLACLAVVVSARYIGGAHAYHLEKHHQLKPKLDYQQEDYHHSHPKYKFRYGVKDGYTHDHKSAWEHRDGDVVKGQYTLDEADGTHRVVDYSSNHKSGFQVHVQRTGHARHPHGESYVKIDQHY